MKQNRNYKHVLPNKPKRKRRNKQTSNANNRDKSQREESEGGIKRMRRRHGNRGGQKNIDMNKFHAPRGKQRHFSSEPPHTASLGTSTASYCVPLEHTSENIEQPLYDLLPVLCAD